MFDVCSHNNRTTSCNVDVPDSIFHDADNNLCDHQMPSLPVFRAHTFTNARGVSPNHTKLPMMAHVFHKTEPVMRCDHAFRPHCIPPLNTCRSEHQ